VAWVTSLETRPHQGAALAYQARGDTGDQVMA
jgi:hypothetical protein